MKQTTSSPFVYRLTSERVHSTITIGVPTLISLVVPVAASMCLISVPVAFRLCSLQCCACVLCLYCLAQLFIKRMPDWLWVSATDGGFFYLHSFSVTANSCNLKTPLSNPPRVICTPARLFLRPDQPRSPACTRGLLLQLIADFTTTAISTAQHAVYVIEYTDCEIHA